MAGGRQGVDDQGGRTKREKERRSRRGDGLMVVVEEEVVPSWYLKEGKGESGTDL